MSCNIWTGSAGIELFGFVSSLVGFVFSCLEQQQNKKYSARIKDDKATATKIHSSSGQLSYSSLAAVPGKIVDGVVMFA